MKIRPCTKKDLKTVEKIFRLPELTLASKGYLVAEFLVRYLDKKYFLVAEEKGRIVGAIYGEPLRAGGVLLWGIAVKKEYRRQGIGSQLMDAFEKNIRSGKKKWAVLYAASKSSTRSFYGKRKYDFGKKYLECAKDL